MTTAVCTKVVIVDDHKLFRRGIMELVNDFEGFTVIWEAENGKDFIAKLNSRDIPDIVLLDISMPLMDGFQTADWLTLHHPTLKTLILSMHNDDTAIMRMLKAGVNGYVLKNIDPSELEKALRGIEEEGSYYTRNVSELLVKSLNKKVNFKVNLQEREIEFLKLACTELPYKSFAPILKIHPRLVESIRDTLFKKLDVQSRVGLAIYAIREGIYKV